MIAKEGRIILIPLLFITFPIGVYAHASNNFVLIILYAILGSLFLFCLNFFRDPVRSIPSEKSIVVAPADGKVVKIMEFGAFVNFLGKQDGLVHISQLAGKRVAKVSDVVKEGDEVSVKVIGFDRGKVKLSIKEAS